MIHFTKEKYSNGLTLIHHQDETTPFVVVNVLYKVGARNEFKDKTGFAHLFEHLMFEGTVNQPSYDHPIQQAGGTNNAFTNNDFTNYYIKLPKENLELAVWLEADRMQFLDINQVSLDTQKKVVIEEFKENYTNKPYGDIWHILRALVYEAHPYKWPTIGKDYSHIKHASLEDVVNFYNTHYQPNNAIVSICGNVNLAKAKLLGDKLLSDIKNKSTHHSNIPEEPLQTKAKIKTVHRAVPQDRIYIVFKMPGRSEMGYYIADVLSDILASGKSSRLKHRLEKQLPLFTEVDTYVTGTLDTGMMVFEGKLKNDITPEEGKDALWKEINLLQSELVNEIELEKVKNKMLTYMAFSENDLMNRAIGLCYHEMLDDASGINEEEEKYMSIRASDIQNFAKKYLNVNQSSTLFYLKE